MKSESMNTDNDADRAHSVPSRFLVPRVKTELERGVDQIISRRNLRLRSSTEDATVPKTYHDDQGQFSSASKYAGRPLTASEPWIADIWTVLANTPERDQISPLKVVPPSTTSSYTVADVAAYASVDSPWRQRALLALHAERVSPKVANVIHPTRRPSDNVERTTLSRHHSSTEPTGTLSEFSGSPANRPTSADPMILTPTSPPPVGSFNSTYFTTLISPATTAWRTKLPHPPSPLAIEDSYSAIPNTSLQSKQRIEAETPSLTFIHETVEHLIMKEEARRKKRQTSRSHSKNRQKKRSTQALLPAASLTDDDSPMAEHTQSPNTHPTSSPAQQPSQSVLKAHPMPDCDPSIWIYLSRSVTSGPKGRALARLEDVLSEDVPIRALLHGWAALGRLSPFWRIIREFDERGLFRIGAVERFAIFRLMHLNLRYASEPTPERAATRPSFMNTNLEHQGDDYISNFTPWPGLRDTCSTAFRSDAFVHLIASSLKIQWPGSIHDCYMRDTSTGLYAISPAFDAAIFDLRSWSFDVELFERYPMLYGLATVANRIPRCVGGEERSPLQKQLTAAENVALREKGVERVYDKNHNG